MDELAKPTIVAAAAAAAAAAWLVVVGGFGLTVLVLSNRELARDRQGARA